MILRNWLGVDHLALPEYRERHVFIARLRLVLLFVFWAVYFYFLKDVLLQTLPIMIVVGGSFTLVGIAYIAIIKERLLIPALTIELVADLSAITTVIYLTGGPYSSYFTLYILYCLAIGLFYHYRLALATSVICATWYACFLILCNLGTIPPLNINYGKGLFPSAPTPFGRWLLLLISMLLAGYTLKIAGHFTKRREKALESRNRELAALHKFSMAIRRAISLETVIEQTLSGVLEGLELETALLLRFDYDEKKILVYSPRKHSKLAEIDKIIGKPLNGSELPWEVLNQPVFIDIMKHKIIFRRSIAEITFSGQPLISPSAANKLQQLLDVGRVVGIPLIVANKVLGTIVGFSRKPFFEDKMIQRFEAFANQTALFLESAELIEKLKKANEKLEEASRTKSEFLALMGHELRTPLTAIIGFSELLLEEVMGKITNEQKECVEEITRNGRDLLTIINSLLELSKAEVGKAKIDVHPVDWKCLAGEVKKTVYPIASDKGQSLYVEVPAQIPNLPADASKIRQVMINLLSNAIKFTPENGLVKMSLHYYPKWMDLPFVYREQLDNNKHDGNLAIVVEDTGIGIAGEQMDKIFDAFYQADSSMTRAHAGAGLGLALTKQFICMHKGSIWAENRKPKGTRFVIILPEDQVNA